MKITKYRDLSISLKITSLILFSTLPFILLFLLYIIPQFVERTNEEKKEAIKGYVNIVYDILEGYNKNAIKGIVSIQEAKLLAAQEINNIRYLRNEYIFGYDSLGITKILGSDTTLLGVNRYELTDKRGAKIVKDMIKMGLQNEEGYYSYYYPRPGETEPKEKISFVKGFKPWGWIIGTGLYFDDLDRYNREHSIRTIIPLLFALLIAVSLGYFVSRKIILSLKKITNVAREITEGNFNTILTLDQKDEIGILADAFNSLANSYKEFALATDIAKIGIWDWDIQKKSIVWGSIMYEIYNQPKSAEITYVKWVDLIHPEDISEFEKSIKYSIKNKTQDFTEYRIMRPDGSSRYIHAAHGSFCNNEGEVVRLVGLNIDITDKMNTERELREALIKAEEANSLKSQALVKLTESEELFRSTFENANVGVCLLGLDGRFLQVNSMLCKMVGYEADELTKFSFLDITYEVDKAKSKAIIDQIDEIINYEKRYVCKDGEIIWVFVSRAVVKNENGQSKYILGYIQDITQRKIAEEELQKHRERLEELIAIRTDALKESERKFRAVVDRATDCVLIFDITGKIIEVNQGACDQLGYEYDELVKLSIPDIDSKNDIKTIQEHIQIVINKGAFFLESVFKRKDNTKFPVEINVNYFEKGNDVYIVGIARDITERKKSEKQIQKLSQAVLQSPAMVVIADKNGNIEFVNPSFSKIKGYSFDEAINSNTRLLRSGVHTKAFYENLWKTITSGKEWTGEFCNKKRSGEWYWEQASISPVKNEYDEITHYISVKVDITERKALIKTLEEAKKVAEEATKIKAEFMANMSHEIRTPMNAIIGLTQSVLRTEISVKQKDYLEKILRSSQSLLGIINDILDFSKIEAGKLNLENIEFTFDDVLDHVRDIISSRIQKKGLELLYKIDSNVPSYLIGDPLRLGQIFINLCSNAIKFTERGEVIIAAKLVDENDETVKIQFMVKDTGIGIKKEDQDKLFAAFSQTDASITRKFGGTGLGLSITKSLAKLLGGDIWVESNYGKGSTFFFTAVFGYSLKNEKKMTVIPIDLRGINVIICDDNRTSRDILKERLELFSFNITAVQSGSELLNKMRENRTTEYNLIIIDMDMPEQNGLDIYKFLQKENLVEGVRVILMVTGYDNDSLINQAEEIGIHSFLEKPMTPSSLYDTIMHAFGLNESYSIRHKKSYQVDYYSKKLELIKGAKILLAEDDEINQQVAFELLESIGLIVTIANNGIQVLEKLADSEYDMILMDLHMPEMDGYTATKKIRKIKVLDSLPVFAMTADAISGVKEKCLEVGMQGFLTKPININELFSALVKYIKPKTSFLTSGTSVVNSGPVISVPAIYGVDATAGIKTVNNNPKLYLNLLEKLITNYSGFEKQITNALSNNDLELAKRLAHTLKGVSANLGASGVQEFSKQLEEVIKKNDSPQIEVSLKNLAKELNLVLESIKSALILSPPKIEAAIKLGKEELLSVISETENHIMEYNPDAILNIEKISFPDECNEELKQLKKSLQKYDFAKGLNHLLSIKNVINKL